MNNFAVGFTPQTVEQHGLHRRADILRQGVRGEPVEPSVFLRLHHGGLAAVAPDSEAQIVIGAAVAPGNPVAQVDKFCIGRLYRDAKLLLTLPGHGLTGRFVFVYMSAAGKIPVTVHIAGVLPQVQQAAGEIISFLQVTPPFSRLNRSYFEQKLAAIFSEEYMEDAKAYLQLTQQEQLICALTGQHSKATMLVRIAQVLGHLSYSLGQYKEALTKFAERLNEPGYDRTSDGYAAMFGQFFKSEPTLSLDNPAWTTLTNASVQYVAATRPGKTEPQLVKRMHYVSFVGMFRSDLFEGLCVGHAPKKCPICGRWFLTIDARHTKYCGGLATGDQRGRTCRQIGNLRGREQRELAADHPIKKIYTK